MSIATEITRLQGAKSDIRNSIIAKGVNVPSADTIDNYSGYIDQISGGGGTTDPMLDEYAFLEIVNRKDSTTKLEIGWNQGYYGNPLKQSGSNFTLYYSMDNKATWTRGAISTSYLRIPLGNLTTGDRIYFKASHNATATCSGANGNNAHFYVATSAGNSTDNITVKAGGNVLSLSWGDDFKGKTTWKNVCFENEYLMPEFCLSELFARNTKILVGINDLRIPMVGRYTCSGMLKGCTNLTGTIDARKIFRLDTANNLYRYGAFAGAFGMSCSPTVILPEFGTITAGRPPGSSTWDASKPSNLSCGLLAYIFNESTTINNVWVKYIDPSYTGTVSLGLYASSGTIHTTSDSKIYIPSGWTRINDYDTNIPPLVY